MSCCIISVKVIKYLKFFISGSTLCRVFDEFLHLSAYTICARMILAQMPPALSEGSKINSFIIAFELNLFKLSWTFSWLEGW